MIYDIGNEIASTYQVTPSYIIKWVIVAIIVAVIFVPLALKIRKALESYRKRLNQAEKRNHMLEVNTNDIAEVKDCMLGFKEVLIEMMHERISKRCKKYIRMQCIPDDEYDDFTRQWKLYRFTLKGNHGLEKRYEKAIVLPLESEYRLHKSEN